MQRSSWIVAITLVTTSSACLILFAQPQDKPTNTNARIVEDDEVNSAIQALWSTDESEMKSAKDKLLQLGPRAIQALTSLLTDVTSSVGPRFAIGREREGAEAWRRFQRAPIGVESSKLVKELKQSEITWRLRKDSLYLLGRLQAEEAVPLIVRLMSTDEMVLSKKDDEMHALIEIGPAAVTRLIEVLETPDDTLASADYWLGHALVDGPRGFRFIPRFIKHRAIMVLGTIGDPRALPILEKVLMTKQTGDITEATQEAIKRINKSMNQRS